MILYLCLKTIYVKLDSILIIQNLINHLMLILKCFNQENGLDPYRQIYPNDVPHY